MLFVAFGLGFATAFVPASIPAMARPAVALSDVSMMARQPFRRDSAAPADSLGRKLAARPKKGRDKVFPLSAGSNYPTTNNIQIQRNGFGTWLQKFQTIKSGKGGSSSKYGVPIFLKNGNVNPAYLAAERKEMDEARQRNLRVLNAKRKKLLATDSYTLASYLQKEIGEVGFQKSRD